MKYYLHLLVPSGWQHTQDYNAAFVFAIRRPALLPISDLAFRARFQPEGLGEGTAQPPFLPTLHFEHSQLQWERASDGQSTLQVLKIICNISSCSQLQGKFKGTGMKGSHKNNNKVSPQATPWLPPPSITGQGKRIQCRQTTCLIPTAAGAWTYWNCIKPWFPRKSN